MVSWYQLTDIKRISDLENWNSNIKKIKTTMLIIAIKGNIHTVVNGESMTLEQGDAYLVRQGDLWECGINTEKDVLVYLLSYHTGETMDSEYDIDNLNEIRSFKIPATSLPPIADLCAAIYRQFSTVTLVERFRSQAIFHELLYQSMKLISNHRDDAAMSALGRVEHFIEHNFHKNVTVEGLAAVAGLSERHLMRQFKENHHCSIMSYVNKRRLQEAKSLLTGQMRKMSEVAELVGYKDEYYFTRKFKQHVGIPPAAYMRNRQKKIAAYSWFNLGHLLPLQVVPEIAPLDHWWTDYYRNKYATDVHTLLSHHYGENRRILEQARPDLIVALNTMDPIEQGRVRQIASTVFIPWMEMDWKEHLRFAAHHLQREKEAELWLERYAYKAALVRDFVGQRLKGEKVLAIRPVKGGVEVFGSRNVGAVLYGDLSLTPAGEADQIAVIRAVSYEELAEYDPDRIFVLTSHSLHADNNWLELSGTDAWKALKAVVQEKVQVVPEDPWVEYTAYGHDRQLSSLMSLFGGNIQMVKAL